MYSGIGSDYSLEIIQTSLDIEYTFLRLCIADYYEHCTLDYEENFGLLGSR
jgi:hypothetical protein